MGTMSHPAQVDEQLRRDGRDLGDFRRAIPRECFRIDPLHAWGTLGRILACLALGVAALAWIDPLRQGAWLWPVLAAMWVLHGWVLVGLFVLGHDCGHQAFSRSARINEIVGTLCMAPLANAFRTWQLTHDHHHRWTQLRGQEVDWADQLVTREELRQGRDWVTRAGYSIPFGIFFWIFWNTLRRAFLQHEMLRTPNQRRKLRASAALTLLVMVTLYGLLWKTGGVWGMLRLHAVPATVAMLTGQFIITIQHAGRGTLLYSREGWTPVRGQLASTFDVRFPAWIEWLWCKINLHVPHHLAPGMPWYHLERATWALRAAFPEYAQERRFGWRDIAWLRRTPFLEEIPGKGYYVLV
jgi:omega-6 fatty acid desaturase (delta-12 desaturase)